MFRTPIPNAERSMLENFDTKQLVNLFAYYLRTGSGVRDYNQLCDAWGSIFSGLYLSAEELIDEMQRGEHRLGGSEERILQEFVHADCQGGGLFVLTVIRKGGKIDRAALIMIAHLEDLAGIEQNGTTALHLLAEACDKMTRPVFIRKAGKRLLGEIYDRRGIPVIFSIFSLADLSLADMDAISAVFTPGELRDVMCRNRTGNNALTVFSEINRSLQSRPSLERHTFYKTPPAKDTDSES